MLHTVTGLKVQLQATPIYQRKRRKGLQRAEDGSLELTPLVSRLVVLCILCSTHFDTPEKQKGDFNCSFYFLLPCKISRKKNSLILLLKCSAYWETITVKHKLTNKHLNFQKQLEVKGSARPIILLQKRIKLYEYY